MSKLRIDTMVLGMVSTNTYILYKEGEGQALSLIHILPSFR